ncbi:MAG: YidB family protein [Devosia sp.]
MSTFGGLGGLLDAAIGQHPGGAGGVFGQALQGIGGFDGVIAQLNKAGLGEKVNSWLGKGPNQPLTADEVRSALSDQHLQQIASQLGIPLDQVAGTLAQHLPAVIDQASPNGTVVAPKSVAQAGGMAGGVGVGGIAGAMNVGGKAST